MPFPFGAAFLFNFGYCMEKVTAFIGHRFVLGCAAVQIRAKEEIEKTILDGCKKIIVGTNGQFENIVLSICREFQKTRNDIEIEVVEIPEYKPKKRKQKDYDSTLEQLDKLFFGDRVDIKRRLCDRNRKMIRRCDTLICYVNKNEGRTAAMTAMNYAKRNGKKVINVFDEKSELACGAPIKENEKF